MPPESQAFAQRAQLSELMDEASTYADFRDCLRDLMRVNRAVLAYRPTLHWLARFADSSGAPLHIVDVGSGAGDMLRRIEGWARRKHIPVRLTGIDRNPHAAQAAREFSGPESRIEWITCDMFGFTPAITVDIVISSLFTHHLNDSEIVRFLAWMEQNAARGWFINDLARGRVSYHGFKLLARLMRWHPFVQHDGPVSIRRSFAPQDWRRYVAEAGLPRHAVEIFSAWPGKLCVSRVK